MKLQIETDTQLVQDPLSDNGNSTREKGERFVSSVTMPEMSSSSASSSTGLGWLLTLSRLGHASSCSAFKCNTF